MSVRTVESESMRSIAHVVEVVREEANGLMPRLLLAQGLSACLPPFVASRVRAAILRGGGVGIGSGTVVFGRISILGLGGPCNLRIGSHCAINVGCVFDASGRIEIGNGVSIGQQVIILTNAHRVGPALRRAGQVETSPVVVEDGAWLSTRAVVLPGVTIGAGSIVAAGAVVTTAVPPNTLVGGVPARPIRDLRE